MRSGPGVEYLASLMGDVRGGLGQEQAVARGDPVHAAASQVAGQGQVISQRVIAAQGELEPVLALGRTMAGSRIAAEAAQDRRDVAHKTHPRGLVQTRDLHRHLDIGIVLSEHENLLALGNGSDVSSVVDLDEAGLGDQLGRARPVHLVSLCAFPRQDQLHGVVGSGELNRLRGGVEGGLDRAIFTGHFTGHGDREQERGCEEQEQA